MQRIISAVQFKSTSSFVRRVIFASLIAITLFPNLRAADEVVLGAFSGFHSVDPFHNVDARGIVDIWINIGEAQIAENIRIPVSLNFRSDRDTGNKILGNGWYCPIWNSHIVEETDNIFVWYRPDGNENVFLRDSGDSSKLIGPPGWKATILAEEIKIIGPDKCLYVLTKGRLNRIVAGTNEISIEYNDGLGTVYKCNGKSTLMLRPSGGNGHEFILESYGKPDYSITLHVGSRPHVVKIAGANVIIGLQAALESAKDAIASIGIEYGTNAQTEPFIKASTMLRADCTTWDAASRKVVSCNGNTYYSDSQKVSEERVIQRISETTSRGEQTLIEQDLSNGVTETKYGDGSLCRTEVFVSGALSGKAKTTTRKFLDKTVIHTKYYYDERGMLLRTINR